jgi:hypothetical protein
MSGSLPVYDEVVEQLIGWIAPTSALDVGTGAGKLGWALHRAAPDCRRVGLECRGALAARAELQSLYTPLILCDATRWWREDREWRRAVWDLVLFGDCLAQMPKSAGLDLVNAMLHRASWLIVVAPEFVVDGGEEGDDAPPRVAAWSERDFAFHDLLAWDNCRATTLLVLRGYRPWPGLTLQQLVERVNEGALPVRDFDGRGLVRPARLRYVERARELSYRPA